ncbi:cell surface immobilization antigen (macronuclear) [Tetrahymena thermophila SB210]|uniref:Cell surface immobilization antigen n=1 Tax=Tetrahymena thermophila (strain SB210) TaxID=312017 RepID=Q235S1_TETTS|nr:cell surface immobilization antigen [Tetrahymena thermophila SB210]EAR92285.1 cell surface immobilization antigen [Tetrahymena thermophila SB210]|eukprot:XP_001012530.1 cell surface immobilization antigen [Tetrahymena thermophila SB210]
MTILKLLLALLLVSQIFAAGADVSCQGPQCSSDCTAAPTTPTGLSWQQGSVGFSCAINSCPANTSSGLVGASDNFCRSCPGTPNGQVQAVFANTAKTACVASSLNCDRSVQWTNADCLICNGTGNIYARVDKSGCQSTAPPGADVSCSTATCSSCTAAPSAPGTLTWQTGSVSGKCAINGCPASTSSGLTGASDLFCQSCPGIPIGKVQAVFANNALTGCVASTATCGTGRGNNTWTDADCIACYGSTASYAKSDKSGCQATTPSSSSTNSMIILSSVLFLISFLF